jgi:periplasmic divalent cation tolerance protein
MRRSTHSIIYSTSANREEACKIARKLIEEKLIACANIFPITSIYRWKREIVEEKEVAIIMKTKSIFFKRIQETIKDLHSYQVPEIILVNINKGNQEYLKWIDESTL